VQIIGDALEQTLSAVMPQDWDTLLDEYLKTIREKKSEHDKRAYFKSKIMEGVFGIKPEYIEYEKEREDMYYAGVLFETKTQINEAKRSEGLEELRQYVKKKSGVHLCVLTDFLYFELYDPNKLDKPIESFTIAQPELNERQEDYKRRVFDLLYRVLYPKAVELYPEPNIIVPRLLGLINKWVSNLYVDGNDIKYIAWKNYISKAFGNEEEATLALYKKHSLLYYTTVLLVARAIGYKDKISDILLGNPFIADGILNFIEEDNFFDFLNHDHEVFRELDDEINRYKSFSDLRDDVFRMLYEDLISPSERHNLGEFYTPEWVAEILTSHAVRKNDVVLDPACGSGTFLRCSIKRKHNLGSKGITASVLGFDINPIAVAIAKANYLFTIRSIGITPEIIPVFLADSLMPLQPPTDSEYITTFTGTSYIRIDFDEIVKGAGTVDFYYDRSWDVKDFTLYLTDLAKGKDKGNLNIGVRNKIEQLAKKGKNHVWYYILRNIYTPYYFRKKIDVVIGNPPWLTYKDVKNSQRQKFLDDLYEHYKMGAGARNKTHQDMAAFFITRCKEYLKPQKRSRIAFVLTRSIFNGDQYDSLRRKEWNLELPRNNDRNLYLWFKNIWDLKANPFHKPACMVFFEAEEDKFDTEIKGTIVGPEKKVKVKDTFKPILSNTKFYINTTRNYSGISETHIKYERGSDYLNDFKQGATIVPRPYFFIQVQEEKPFGSKVSTDPIYTILKNKRTSKASFGFAFKEDYVPNDLIYYVILGEDIDHFKCNLIHRAVLPIKDGECIFDVKIDNKSYNFELKDEFKQERLYVNYEELFNKIEKDWERHRGSKFSLESEAKASTKMNVFDWLNYSNKLLAQNTSPKCMLVYNESGTEIRAAVLENKSNVVVEHKAYYAYFDEPAEAYYLCGILNSRKLLTLLKEAGILSERHIEKKPFDIPFPKYDKRNSLHIKISQISKEISDAVEKGNWVEEKMRTLEELVESLLKNISSV
jgi:hypothetical protein